MILRDGVPQKTDLEWLLHHSESVCEDCKGVRYVESLLVSDQGVVLEICVCAGCRGTGFALPWVLQKLIAAVREDERRKILEERKEAAG